MHRRFTLFSFTLAIALHASTAGAEWQPDGTPMTSALNEQSTVRMVADGSGGAIMVWSDWRSNNSDIFAQRVNALGIPQWNPDGVVICNQGGYQSYPSIVSDGAGGVIMAWHDGRSGIPYDIYVQRVNAAGVVQWTANGVALCAAVNDQAYPSLVSDGAGGAIAAWMDYRSGVGWDIYARRVNASGVPQWVADGVALCTAGNNQIDPRIVSDGAGGAIASWEDYRAGAFPDVFAQRVSSTGVPQWLGNGFSVCTAANVQANPDILADGA